MSLSELYTSIFIPILLYNSVDNLLNLDNISIGNDLLLITGVGKVFPFMRVHALLNALQENFNKKPIVVLYPGTFDGHYVKLFNKLKSNEYYRAFNMI